MISIQRMHIYLNLPTYSFDQIKYSMIDFVLEKHQSPDLQLSCKFIATLFVQRRMSHIHESRNSKQGLNACIVFVGVVLLGSCC